MKKILTLLASTSRIRDLLKRNNWRIALVAIAFLTAGAVLSHRIEPGVRVKTVIIAGHTPALQFSRADSAPHPVALLAHGLHGSKETLFRLGEALATAGFVCFALDFPGHGASARSFSRPESARTLTGVAREIGPVDVFIGHSLGAGAGAESVRNGGFRPQLFIAVGALPDLGEHRPPLLLLVGEFDEAIVRSLQARGPGMMPLSAAQFEEAFPTAGFGSRTDLRLVLFSWCDHALEPYDPRLVNVTVEAACAAAGKAPPATPTRWLWRLVGVVLGGLGALGLTSCLPAFSPRLAGMRGPLIALIALASVILTTSTWIGAAPVLRRVPLQLA